MTQDVDAFLTRQLDVLDVRGRRHLHARAARAGLVHVASVLPPAMLLVSFACLVWSVFQPLTIGWTVSIIAATALVVALAAYSIGRPGDPVDRVSALAVFDDQLGLKDRLRTANEFLGIPHRGGFRNAALQETLSAVGQALAHPLTVAREPSPADALRRRWPAMTAAIVLLVVTGVVSHPGASGDGTIVADTGRAAWRAARLVPAPVVSKSPPGHPDGPGRGSGSGAGRPGAAPGTGERSDRDGPSVPSRAGDPNRLGIASNGVSGAGSAGGDAGSGPGAGAGRSGGSGSALAGRGASDGAPRSAAEAIGAADAAASGASSTLSATRPRPGDRTASATPGRTGKAAPPTPRRPAPQPGEGTPPGSQSRSQKGDGGSSRPGQGNGQGSDGQRSGAEEALKKSRGMSGLLLAVPMQDRLIGTANAGPVESVVRRAGPGRSSAATGRVGDRGIASGTVGRIPHRVTTAQERLLLERYFRRGPVAGTTPR